MSEFKPGDIISCDACGKPMMRRVIRCNGICYVVENLRGDKCHSLPVKVAEACWQKVGGER